MNRQAIIILFLTISVLTQSCKETPLEAKDSAATSIKKAPSTEQKTQALILTQDFPYDTENADSISGPYIKKKKLSVPLNLKPQNKWFMFEGPVLENDVVAYRYYADSRHRFDIYGKQVSDLVMDTVGWKYHDIMDWGSDILKVGNSLGIGSPAIRYKDSLYYLTIWDNKTIEIIENGNDRSMIRTTFTGLKIEDFSFDLIQDWSIEAGASWSEISLKVPNGNLPDGMQFATGFIKHLPEISHGHYDDVFYAMNWGNQSFHNEELGMAIIAHYRYEPTHISDTFSHAYVFNKAENEVTYRFMSAWERDKSNVTDTEAFQQLVHNASKTVR